VREKEPFKMLENLLHSVLNTNKQSIRHFYIAKGSTAEVITQLIIAKEIGYLPPEITEELIKEYEHVSHMLAKLIAARSKTP
jgi:four helix bundle protein